MSDYLLDVRQFFRAALNSAPKTYFSTDGAKRVWMPLRDHLRMPHEVQERVCHGRDIDLRRLNYSGHCLNWFTAELWQSVRTSGDLDAMGRRKKSEEDTFFYALDPKGDVDCILRLVGRYANRARASERFSHDAYTAELGEATVVDLSPRDIDALWRETGMFDPLKAFEQFVRRELSSIEQHHEHGLDVVKTARDFIAQQVVEEK